MAETRVVITEALRTPIGKFLGAFKDFTAVQLGTSLLNHLLSAGNVDRAVVDQVIVGSARQAGLGPNPARQIACAAGVPDSCLAMTVNQACGSGLRAMILAAQELQLGRAQVVVAGGIENLSRVPFLLDRFREGYGEGDGPVVDAMYQDGYHCPMSNKVMGATVEDLASDPAAPVSRAEQDEFAHSSQARCEAARKAGRFRDEIAPVMVSGRLIEDDEHPRDGVSLESLAKLPAVFRRTGSITAGNSSGITDGAAFVLMMTEDRAEELGLKPLAYFEEHATAGIAPKRMGLGPVPAIQDLLKRLPGRRVEDFDLIEINEAFAAQVIACERALGLDRERLNVNGGAIALGHPTGCTGCRIVVTLLHELRRRGARQGLASLCVSGGYGVAASFRRDESCR